MCSGKKHHIISVKSAALVLLFLISFEPWLFQTETQAQFKGDNAAAAAEKRKFKGSSPEGKKNTQPRIHVSGGPQWHKIL